MDNEEFWATIEDWSENPTIVNAEFCGNTSLHEKIYEECKKYDNWTHSFSEDWPDDTSGIDRGAKRAIAYAITTS